MDSTAPVIRTAPLMPSGFIRPPLTGRLRFARRPYHAAVDERLLTERLIGYDTATIDGLRAAAGFVKGWLESRDLRVRDHVHEGLPVVLAGAGAPPGAEAPTVVFHGHVDVVPGREGQFDPRVEGDRLYGRGAYDMKGALAAMLLTTASMREQDRVRVRIGIVGDEESEEERERGSDHLVDSGFVGDFAITGEPTDLHIGV